MTVLRASGMTWDPNSTTNTFMKKCPMIGYQRAPSVLIQSGTTDANFPVDNLLNQSTHLRWKDDGSGRSTHVIQVDSLDTTLQTNYVGIAVHNLSGFNVSITAAIPNSPTDFVSVFATQQIPNNRPLILEFAKGAYSSLQISIDNTALIGDDFKEIAILHAGRVMRMNRGVKVESDHLPVTRGLKSDALTGYSESGQFVGKLIRNQIWDTKFEFTHISDDFFNGTSDEAGQMTKFLQEIVPEFPFFMSWAPDDYYQDVGFMWATQDYEPMQNPVTRRWALAMQVRGFSGFDL